MRVFGSIVQVIAYPMMEIRQHRLVSYAVAAKTIGDEASRLVSQSFQRPLEQTLGSRAIWLLLHKNVESHAMLIRGTPRMRISTSSVPAVSRLRPSATQAHGKLGAELVTPFANTLVSNYHTPFGQDQLDVARTETEHMIQPHYVADDLSRKAAARHSRWGPMSFREPRLSTAQALDMVDSAMPTQSPAAPWVASEVGNSPRLSKKRIE